MVLFWIQSKNSETVNQSQRLPPITPAPGGLNRRIVPRVWGQSGLKHTVSVTAWATQWDLSKDKNKKNVDFQISSGWAKNEIVGSFRKITEDNGRGKKSFQAPGWKASHEKTFVRQKTAAQCAGVQPGQSPRAASLGFEPGIQESRVLKNQAFKSLGP